MARKRVESWVVTDEFWQRVEPLWKARLAEYDEMASSGGGRGARIQVAATANGGVRIEEGRAHAWQEQGRRR